MRPPAHPPLHQHQPGRRRRGGRARNAILQVTTISSAFNCRYNQRKGSRTSAPRALQPTAPMPACQADVASGMPHASLSSCRLFGPTLLLSRAPLLQTTTLNGLSAFHARLNARPLPRRRRLSPLLPRAGHARLATSTITAQSGRNASRESKLLLCEVHQTVLRYNAHTDPTPPLCRCEEPRPTNLEDEVEEILAATPAVSEAQKTEPIEKRDSHGLH